MKIIIAGAGDVGFHLAKMLSFEYHDIVLMDIDKEKLSYAETHLDIMVYKGNSTSPGNLINAGISDCDLLIGVTASQTINITIAIIGKQLGAKKTVARVSYLEYVSENSSVDFKSLGIDYMISPGELAAIEIERLIKNSAFTDTFEFDKGELSLVGLSLDDTAPLTNKGVQELSSLVNELNFMPVAIQRKNETIIPRGSTYFKEGDHIYFVVQPEGTKKVMDLCNKCTIDINNIMILGGSKIGYKTARNLCNKYNIKLIELNAEKANELADDLKNVLVIHGDGTKVELLEEESINEMEAFIAVTGNSETNIMSCLLAKAKGVSKTIALVENMDYIHLSHTIGIDTLINKKLIAAANIFRHVRKGNIISMHNLIDMDAEILEFEVNQGSKITKSSIKDLKFPDTALIGGLVRNGKGQITLGNTQILAGDHVVVFAMPDAIKKVESFFN